jgi:hypothetical protein
MLAVIRAMNKYFALYTFPAVFISFVLLPYLGIAQQTSAKRQASSSKYTLFNPVPKTLMRDMDTDRPDITEAPETVDAGHFQFETDLINIERKRSDDKEQTTTLINQFNLKLGLTTTTALQVGFQSFGVQQERNLSGGDKATSRGVGDITVRLKQNLVGNDNGLFAMALLPYIKFPTAQYQSDGRFEGGFIVPMQMKLPGEWKIGMQVEGDRLKDEDMNTLHTEFLQSLTICHELAKHLDGLAETYYTYNFKDKHWANFLNAALQVEAAKDFKVDAGLNYGLQHDAEKTYFLGMSVRF